MRRHNAVPHLNDGTASRSSRRTPERRDTQPVSQPPSGPGLPMWDTIGGMILAPPRLVVTSAGVGPLP
jgi:hypothetical protein